ncbi:MAG TPA: M14 family zinc carboxypeptidase [Candidatus Paceibacterota bacterium]|nr:M14 family zinc carboxypeptidase [Candidatus Paceibacterota bacterium]
MRRSPLQKFIGVAVFVLGIVGLILFLVGKNEQVKEPDVAPVEQATSSEPVREVIGTSVEGREIEAYTFGTGAKRLLFAGGMHGGYEWNSVLLAYEFMDYVTENPNLIPEGISISVIPSINPDGVFTVVGKEGRFTLADISAATQSMLPAGAGRFNANDVDLNRNFDCKWQPTSTWRSKTVSAGTAPFSEPEAKALQGFVLKYRPSAVVFWHSQANSVYASECTEGILPVTIDVMNAYASAAGYSAVSSFDAYPVTGDAEGWLASIGIPAITVELKTHETIEWDKNLAGVKAVLKYFSK